MEHISFHNHETVIKDIDPSKLPLLLQEGISFFKEAQEFYDSEKTVKEAIDLYLKRLNEYLQDQYKKKPTQRYDFGFIEDFVSLHEKRVSKGEIGDFIEKLQRAITRKLVLKNSSVASHIQEIQEKLINQYNQLSNKDSVTLIINPTWLENLRNLLHPQNNVLDGFENETLNPNTTVQQPRPKKNNSLFESISAINQEVNPNTFRLEDDFGVFLGDLERFELAITIEGNQGSGKTRFTYQLANAFANLNHRIAIFSLEIGSKSDLIRRMKEDYLESQNHSNVFIADMLPKGMDTIGIATLDWTKS